MKAVSRIAFVTLVLGAVTALAQPDAAAPVGNGSGSSAPAPKVAGPSTMAELATRTEIMSAQMQADYQQALRLKDVAKKQKDVIKLNCVNDHLVEMKAQLNLADAAKAKLTSTGGDGNAKVSPETSAVFELYSAKAESIREQREQSAACIGVEISKQDTGLEVSAPDVTDDPNDVDPYGGTDLPGVVIEPPGYASAFN